MWSNFKTPEFKTLKNVHPAKRHDAHSQPSQNTSLLTDRDTVCFQPFS